MGEPLSGDFSRRHHAAGWLLGIALGGFFDGILLHQILQWHHLLSGLEADSFRDIRAQILADGLFHTLMYVIAGVGIVQLIRTRDELGRPQAERMIAANVLIGFGVWHVADSVLSHWLTGIHRIRMDSPNPLLWDLIWFTAFGAVPLIAGAVLRRGAVTAGVTRGRVAGLLLAGAVLGAGAWSLRPPPGVTQTVIYFPPGTTSAQVFAAAQAVDARVVWSDRSGELWVFDFADIARAPGLYGRGALFVGTSLLPAGCVTWSRAS